MSWTDERVETLKRMWNEGQSASQIAKELGGVTRNAVIGKVHRLGLSNRVGGKDRKRKRPPRAVAPVAAGDCRPHGRSQPRGPNLRHAPNRPVRRRRQPRRPRQRRRM